MAAQKGRVLLAHPNELSLEDIRPKLVDSVFKVPMVPSQDQFSPLLFLSQCLRDILGHLDEHD
jgi:hypothetical protein